MIMNPTKRNASRVIKISEERLQVLGLTGGLKIQSRAKSSSACHR